LILLLRVLWWLLCTEFWLNAYALMFRLSLTFLAFFYCKRTLVCF
jgi:hypothetical protein